MSYKSTVRDKAILDIASGHPDLKNIALYESLPSFNRITITWSGKIIESVALTYSGEQLGKRLLKSK